MFRTSRLLLSIVCLAAMAEPAQAAGKKPPLEGLWNTPAGRVTIVRHSTEVTGTLTTPAPGVKLDADSIVITGSFEDDNLSAEIPVDLVLAGCHGGKSAFAMLLLTASGKLTGGVSTKDKCAGSVSTLVFKKVTDAAPAAKPPDAPSAPTAEYDSNGKRLRPMNRKTKAVLTDAAQYMKEGQFEKARALFQLVVDHDPIVGEAYNGLGVTYAMRNDYDTAITWYKRGLEAAPGFGDLYYNLACAYAQLAKPSIAVRYLKLAANKGYTDVENIDTDSDLEPIRKEAAFIELRRGLGQSSASPVVPPAPAPAAPPPAAPPTTTAVPAAPAAAAPPPATQQGPTPPPSGAGH